MESKKQPRRVQAGSVQVRRALENQVTGEEREESGSAKLDCPPSDDLVAEVTGNVGMTWPTDVKFQMLRIDVGGRMPCTEDAFVSGQAHGRLMNILWQELQAQHKRGTRGL
jgi:hypothetical protein